MTLRIGAIPRLGSGQPGLGLVGSGVAAPPPSPPVNTVAPAITPTSGGTGTVLTCSTGTWTGSPSFTFQWKNAGVAIVGETANTYTVVAGDLGDAITCTVTGTNAGGSASATSNTVTPAAAMDGSTVLTGPSDTFVEAASDTTITAHTPTGPNAGTSWSVPSGGGILVKAAGDYAADDNGGASNRGIMSNDLGSDQHGVEAEFTTTATAGQSVFFGVACRAAAGTIGIEFLYMMSTGNWRIDDDAGGVVTLTEAWPGGTVTMRVVYQSGVVKGYVNGVLKLSLTTSAGAGRTRGGIAMLNFSGSLDKVHADNYKSMAA